MNESLTIEVRLNGSPCSLEVAVHHTLLDVLRDEIGLTGTKECCVVGECGACTVHLGGQAARSCMTPVSAVAGQSVTTIEGLDTEAGEALQNAWVSEQVPQCGYCQSGQIMTAAGLLADNPNPSDDDITNAMDGNLCRCMAYPRIRKAIKSAANGGGA